MENNLDSLLADPRNPRTISRESFDKLKEMLKEYGDLGSVIFNETTGQLVGGHRRVDAFKALGANKEIKITTTYDQPTRTGTVALGYVIMDGEPHTYRVVRWSAERQRVANIAANAVGELAEWDRDMLAETMADIAQLENASEQFELTALAHDDINRLLESVGAVDDDQSEKPTNFDLSFTLTESQRETIDEALGHIKATRTIVSDDNKSMNGGALFYICRDYLDRLHAQAENADPAIMQANAEPSEQPTADTTIPAVQ